MTYVLPDSDSIARIWMWLADNGVEDPPADYRIERVYAMALTFNKVTSPLDEQGKHEAFVTTIEWLGYGSLVEGVL